MSTLCTVCNHYPCPGCLGAAQEKIERLTITLRSISAAQALVAAIDHAAFEGSPTEDMIKVIEFEDEFDVYDVWCYK